MHGASIPNRGEKREDYADSVGSEPNITTSQYNHHLLHHHALTLPYCEQSFYILWLACCCKQQKY